MERIMLSMVEQTCWRTRPGGTSAAFWLAAPTMTPACAQQPDLGGDFGGQAGAVHSVGPGMSVSEETQVDGFPRGWNRERRSRRTGETDSCSPDTTAS